MSAANAQATESVPPEGGLPSGTTSRGLRVAGWILTLLLTALLIVSARFKLADVPGKEEQFAKLGFSVPVMAQIGWVELAAAALFVIPQTSFFGTILLTGYLGGATCAHVRIGEPFLPPVMIGVLVWIAFSLRRPDVLRTALWPHR